MTLLQLQYFKTLAHVLHYTQAAAQLHIAQPSLSYSIKELEKELGVKLFEKDSRHVRLTIYGEQFLPYAERALSMLDEGVGVLQQMAEHAQQVVRLGYFHSISASLIPSVMLGFYGQEGNQNIRFQFVEAPSFDLYQQLKKGGAGPGLLPAPGRGAAVGHHHAPAPLPGGARVPPPGGAQVRAL